MDTIWCFDFQEIFEKSIRRSWRTALLSYVNIFSDIAFVQTPGKDGCTVTKQEQTLIMSLLISILSVMFNYTNIDLPSAARSLRALIQAPLSVFKSAGIALILANQLNKNKTTKAYLEECVQTGDITQNDLRCIEAISSMLPSLPSHLLNTVSEFAQTAIRIPSSFISVKELVLKANPHYTNFSTATDNTTKFVQNGFSAYSSKYFLEPVSREPGLNKVAMVAFDVRLNTPECLEYDLNLELQPRGASGRDIVLISNDITIDAGSFGTEEDIVFDLASKRARELGIPRIYLAANSGARIGLADELKGKFKVAFIQGDEEYTRGFQYLYLTEKIYQEYKSSVVCKKISVELPTGEKEDRYIITDIVGKKDNLGVENLRGSGCIAGETSQAYQDVFTLTYVTCRTVGIGAYLARLGQRVIQKADPAMPLLLTGYQALNKLLGKSVYTSNVQLGGPDIMYTNGVSHQIVSNDLQGCSNIVQWLSYVPRRRVNFVSTSKDALFAKKNIFNTQSLLSQTIDPISRKPTFSPTARNQLYDPRHLLVGSTTHSPVLGLFQQFITFQKKFSALSAPVKVHSPAAASTPADLNSSIPLDDITAVLSHFQLAPIQQSPVSGLFDIFSFMEVLGGWAKGVVTGRARLGGIPVGVICVDTRTIDRTVPADPAAVDTQETVVSRAGQVWFPESSYKTAQAIFDLKAEDLPIVVLANWRGFSGGMQDMLNEILKFGSYIVDALHAIQQPIMVYLPPMSTLRGGAWVVIDPTINYDFMEMYADETSRGGVLEPEGIVDIKFRREQILLEMRRADPIIIQYNQQLIVARAANDVAQVTHITNAIKHREVALFPMYLQLATHFADLHDTPVRMQQKGCLNDVVNWETARERFYWRIKARQLEQYFVNAILAVLDKNTDDNDITVLNLQPNTNSAYQHGILHRVLTEKYKLPLFDKLQDSNTTTTHASTNQLARALVQLWFAQDIPGSKAGKNGINIPSFNVGGKSDEDFVRFVQSGFTAEGNWLQTYLDGQIGELLKFKTRTELAVMAKKFSKEELLEMLQKM
jgi:acetyl-CoA carboxylase carboxyltransferase component